ncbi:MAG: hypothetical protein AAF583_08095 [Pseudomonadota bacterium]
MRELAEAEKGLIFALPLVDDIEELCDEREKEWPFDEVLETNEMAYCAIACGAIPEGTLDTPIGRACDEYRDAQKRASDAFNNDGAYVSIFEILEAPARKALIRAVRDLAYDISVEEEEARTGIKRKYRRPRRVKEPGASSTGM